MAQVRTRKRGKTYSYIFEAGKTEDGKRKVVEKGGFATKVDAYKAGVEAYNDFIHGNIGITSEKVTLKDFMTAWLREAVATEVKPTTTQRYWSFTKNHILPQLGSFHVQNITPAILDNWIRKLFTDGYAFYTISGIYTLLKHALDYAVYPTQLINSNPAAYIKVPKKAPRNIVKRTIVTPEQFAALLEKFPFGSPFYIPLLLLYHTGMRLGEVLGLMWRDIDFTAKRIVLKQQIPVFCNKNYFFTTLKTKSSERYIIINDFLVGELRRWKEQQSVNELKFGDGYVYVYRGEDGKVIQQSKSLPLQNAEQVFLVCTQRCGKIVLRASLSKALKNEGLNAHSFRHTHATRLIENGAPPKGVAARLGHVNTQITQNLYTHNTVKLQEETAAIFDFFWQTT